MQCFNVIFWSSRSGLQSIHPCFGSWRTSYSKPSPKRYSKFNQHWNKVENDSVWIRYKLWGNAKWNYCSTSNKIFLLMYYFGLKYWPRVERHIVQNAPGYIADFRRASTVLTSFYSHKDSGRVCSPFLPLSSLLSVPWSRQSPMLPMS